MSARWIAFVTWAAVAASAVFWLLRLAATSPAAPAHTVAVATASLPRGDLARVLGAAPVATDANSPAAPEPALASRFKLLGVAAPRQGGDVSGLALIAVDGKPARGFKVGAAVDGEMVLQSVHPRGAALGARGAPSRLNLELPALPPAATGPRPGSAGFASPSTVGAPPPVMPGIPGAGPVATLPPAVETQEPVAVPPPPPLPGMPANR
jgi:general secretion pathway protein C